MSRGDRQVVPDTNARRPDPRTGRPRRDRSQRTRHSRDRRCTRRPDERAPTSDPSRATTTLRVSLPARSPKTGSWWSAAPRPATSSNRQRHGPWPSSISEPPPRSMTPAAIPLDNMVHVLTTPRKGAFGADIIERSSLIRLPGLCGLMVVWAPRLSSTALGPRCSAPARASTGLRSAHYAWAAGEHLAGSRTGVRPRWRR